MAAQWKSIPPVLRRKLLLTLLAGLSSVLVSLAIYLSAGDRVLLVLSGLILAACVLWSRRIWHTAIKGEYETICGTCTGVSSPMLRQYRKVQLQDEQGRETTLLLSRSAKVQVGARYCFYLQKGAERLTGNDYLDTALSTSSFLGYEELPPADAESSSK